MNRTNIIKLVVFFPVVCFFIGLSLPAETKSQNFKIFIDGLDSFGGRDSSTNFWGRIGSGGQPAVVGVSEGDSFYAWQGYVHTAAFVHGDCDRDGRVGLADAVYLINYTLKGGPEPIPLETGDMNCPDNYIDLADVVYLINYLFRNGPAPCNL